MSTRSGSCRLARLAGIALAAAASGGRPYLSAGLTAAARGWPYLGAALTAAALAVAGGSGGAIAHPLYIGRVAATLGDSALRGRLSVNRLDFLEALATAHGDRLFGLSRPQLDSLAAQYLRGHLAAVADGDTLALAIEGTGQERDEVWFHFTFAAARPVALLALEVTVLFELYPEQRNLLELTTPLGVHRHVFSPSRPILVQEVARPRGAPP